MFEMKSTVESPLTSFAVLKDVVQCIRGSLFQPFFDAGSQEQDNVMACHVEPEITVVGTFASQ